MSSSPYWSVPKFNIGLIGSLYLAKCRAGLSIDFHNSEKFLLDFKSPFPAKSTFLPHRANFMALQKIGSPPLIPSEPVDDQFLPIEPHSGQKPAVLQGAHDAFAN